MGKALFHYHIGEEEIEDSVGSEQVGDPPVKSFNSRALTTTKSFCPLILRAEIPFSFLSLTQSFHLASCLHFVSGSRINTLVISLGTLLVHNPLSV